jgi:hypothetical protein
MSAGDDSLPTAVLTAQEQDLRPLLEESIDELELDDRQVTVMENGLHEAWLFGIKTGHKVMIETRMGKADPMPAILSLQDEFQDVMERCAEGLNLTVQATVAAWNYLGQAWIAGAKFWEIEIVARLIEWHAGGSDGVLEWLEG